MTKHSDGFLYITGTWLADALFKEHRDADWDLIDAECDGHLDVRLQVVDGNAFVHSGDPQFDRDARGYWGSSSITRDTEDFAAVAHDLVQQARDMSTEDES